MSTVQGFTNPQNEKMLSSLLLQDFQRRLGSDLSDKQKERLVKTIRHYMGEVNQTIPQANVQMKNKEVLTAVVPDFLSYIRRSQVTVQEEDATLRQDIGTRFSQLQNERNPKKPTVPAPPDFRIPLDNEEPVSMSIFEQIKKQREEEAQRSDEMLKQRVTADQNYNSMQGQAAAQDQLVLSTRETSRMAAQRESASELASRMIAPDPRRIFMKDVMEGNPVGQQNQGTSLETLLRPSPFDADNRAAGNATLALPSAATIRPPRPQDMIIPQDDVLTYKENEYNLFMYSADRDWLSGNPTLQNRYNFTVNFDPANNRAGQLFGVNAAASIKFKNITRIEFVKAILPVEGVNTIMRKNAATTASVNYDVSLNVNILSFPYLNLYVKELDTNSYGTDYNFERAFGVLQYDANWISDNNVTTKGGYLAMIPKFLKCQKVYTPTPLSTLQKLTLRLERPDGNLVSDIQDTLDISGIASSGGLSGNTTDGSYLTNGVDASANIVNTKYADGSNNYIWLEASSYFSRFSVAQGDRIRIRGVTFPSNFTGNAVALADLVNWLNTTDQLVIGTAWSTRVGNKIYFKDGWNQVGYSKYIIIQSRMNDPTTGSILPTVYGGLSSANNATFLSKLRSNTLTAGRLINLSHQTHFVFRIITRDMDSTSRLRPDNL
jgi:hypothetical protein